MLKSLVAAAALVMLSVVPALAQVPVVAKMVGANFLLAVDGRPQCSATLLSTTTKTVLTNQHCIENAVTTMEREEVQADGTVKKVTRVFYEPVTLLQHIYSDQGIVGRLEYRAEILAFDKAADLAALRVLGDVTFTTASSLPPAKYVLVQGQEVWAVGNPALLENTVTKGILSHLHREFRWSADQVAHYIQTDAAIAGGSSGGALYSTEGYLIGVPSAGYRGAALSFAIPFTRIQEFLNAKKIVP